MKLISIAQEKRRPTLYDCTPELELWEPLLVSLHSREPACRVISFPLAFGSEVCMSQVANQKKNLDRGNNSDFYVRRNWKLGMKLLCACVCERAQYVFMLVRGCAHVDVRLTVVVEMYCCDWCN